MAMNSNIFAWKIPWIEELVGSSVTGGLQSMGSQRSWTQLSD